MKKSNFVALVLGTIGTVFFALGMCMALIEDWGMFRQGVVCGVIGIVVLLVVDVGSGGQRAFEHRDAARYAR